MKEQQYKEKYIRVPENKIVERMRSMISSKSGSRWAGRRFPSSVRVGRICLKFSGGGDEVKYPVKGNRFYGKMSWE